MNLVIEENITRLVVEGDTILEIVDQPTTLVINDDDATVLEIRNVAQGAIVFTSDRLNPGKVSVLFDSPYPMKLTQARFGIEAGSAEVSVLIDDAPVLSDVVITGPMHISITDDNDVDEGSTVSLLVTASSSVEDFSLTLKAQGA